MPVSENQIVVYPPNEVARMGISLGKTTNE